MVSTSSVGGVAGSIQQRQKAILNKLSTKDQPYNSTNKSRRIAELQTIILQRLLHGNKSRGKGRRIADLQDRLKALLSGENEPKGEDFDYDSMSVEERQRRIKELLARQKAAEDGDDDAEPLNEQETQEFEEFAELQCQLQDLLEEACEEMDREEEGDPDDPESEKMESKLYDRYVDEDKSAELQLEEEEAEAAEEKEEEPAAAAETTAPVVEEPAVIPKPEPVEQRSTSSTVEVTAVDIEKDQSESFETEAPKSGFYYRYDFYGEADQSAEAPAEEEVVAAALVTEEPVAKEEAPRPAPAVVTAPPPPMEKEEGDFDDEEEPAVKLYYRYDFYGEEDQSAEAPATEETKAAAAAAAEEEEEEPVVKEEEEIEKKEEENDDMVYSNNEMNHSLSDRYQMTGSDDDSGHEDRDGVGNLISELAFDILYQPSSRMLDVEEKETIREGIKLVEEDSANLDPAANATVEDEKSDKDTEEETAAPTPKDRRSHFKHAGKSVRRDWALRKYFNHGRPTKQKLIDILEKGSKRFSSDDVNLLPWKEGDSAVDKSSLRNENEAKRLMTTSVK